MLFNNGMLINFGNVSKAQGISTFTLPKTYNNFYNIFVSTTQVDKGSSSSTNVTADVKSMSEFRVYSAVYESEKPICFLTIGS